jgi:hypothetical protein
MKNISRLCHKCGKREAMPGDSWCIWCEDHQEDANRDAAQERQEREDRDGSAVD